MIVNKHTAQKFTSPVDSVEDANPTFTIKMDNQKICDANRPAIAGCKTSNPIGKSLTDVLHVEDNVGNAKSPAFFNGQWFSLVQETLLWKNKSHIKISLQQRKDIPDFNVIHSLKNMISLLLHRMRSPLTGIQGYVTLMKDGHNSNLGYLDKLDQGIGQISGLLNELEALQKISQEPIQSSYSAGTQKVIQDILTGLPEKTQASIAISPGYDEHQVNCSPEDLNKVLDILISNAVEHVGQENANISIDLSSPNAISVSHQGNPIPESISEELFFPFVTSKATSLGIGLTMAILYAKRHKGTIFLTDNSPLRGVSFTLCFPPAQLSLASLGK